MKTLTGKKTKGQDLKKELLAPKKPFCEAVLAIDPGDVQSAFTFMESATYEPLYFDKLPNEDAVVAIKNYINQYRGYMADEVAIEMIASYGMAVGKTVFETCVMIGRFYQIFTDMGLKVRFIYRKDVKMNVCGSTAAKDSNIRVALIDRFAKHDLKRGTGTMKDPDWFYGFRQDVWAAYAVGVSYIDLYLK